jgi:hypothetical protein
MRVQVHKACKECHKSVVISLNHMPEHGSTFWFHCPHCFEPNMAHFRECVPDGKVLNTVVGIVPIGD